MASVRESRLTTLTAILKERGEGGRKERGGRVRKEGEGRREREGEGGRREKEGEGGGRKERSMDGSVLPLVIAVPTYLSPHYSVWSEGN